MARRIHVPLLRPGEIPLESAQAHHARNVLRLPHDTEVDVFDDAGASAAGVLLHLGAHGAAVQVTHVHAPIVAPSIQWTVASAVPKGERADWMVEKLSELGAAAFIPLATARSVVLPEGKGKRERWMRIATEAARQSRRAGVMRIDLLTPLQDAIKTISAPIPEEADPPNSPATPSGRHASWFLATEVPGMPIAEAAALVHGFSQLTVFIGPEGGWTQSEIAALQAAGMTAIRIGATILRVETAAVAAGAVIRSCVGS